MVWLQPPAPAFPPPTSLLWPVYLALSSESHTVNSYSIRLSHPPGRTLPHSSSKSGKISGKMLWNIKIVDSL